MEPSSWKLNRCKVSSFLFFPSEHPAALPFPYVHYCANNVNQRLLSMYLQKIPLLPILSTIIRYCYRLHALSSGVPSEIKTRSLNPLHCFTVKKDITWVKLRPWTHTPRPHIFKQPRVPRIPERAAHLAIHSPPTRSNSRPNVPNIQILKTVRHARVPLLKLTNVPPNRQKKA